jgi:hypothetical protein
LGHDLSSPETTTDKGPSQRRADSENSRQTVERAPRGAPVRSRDGACLEPHNARQSCDCATAGRVSPCRAARQNITRFAPLYKGDSTGRLAYSKPRRRAWIGVALRHVAPHGPFFTTRSRTRDKPLPLWTRFSSPLDCCCSSSRGASFGAPRARGSKSM